jgi:hypothetical protein
MLKHINKTIQRCFAVEKRLFVYDPEDYNAARPESGIRATIFGASGILYYIKDLWVDQLVVF